MTALKKDNGMVELINYATGVVTKISGNVLGDKQSFMVESRLTKRILELKMKSPSEYLAYIKTHKEKEHDFLVSILTTHHTFFFREFSHFEYLQAQLPVLVEALKAEGRDTLEVISLACSRGQEVYSLAMFLEYHLVKNYPGIKYKVYGSDVDKESVKIAQNGVYRYNEIKSAPMKYISGHWQKGTGDISHFAKVKDSIKKNCVFTEGNILKVPSQHSGRKYDVIFCRNVFIYFEEHQIVKISRDVLNILRPHGLYFTGISESLNNYSIDRIHSFAPSVYGHVPAEVAKAPVGKASASASIAKVVPAKSMDIPEKLKILCVDDSKTVLTLLKKVFGDHPNFDLVGTCENGLEAQEFIKNNEVDVMTLDIHMPEMDGVTYLEKNYNKKHPAVVMVSSASREDSSHALKALKLGASDFVEKPALNDIAQKGDEICTKLRVAYLDKINEDFHISTIDKQFSKDIVIESPKDNGYFVYVNFGDRKRLSKLIKDIAKENHQPPSFIFFEGNYDLLPELVSQIQGEIRHVDLVDLNDSQEYESDTIYYGDFKKHYGDVSKTYKDDHQVMMVIGNTSEKAKELIINQSPKYLLVEDLGNATDSLKDAAIDCLPVTSFAYLAHSYLAKK